MSDPSQPAGNTIPAANQAALPASQNEANARQSSDPSGSQAKHTEANPSAIISRLAGQRDSLRTENKMLREEISSINKKVDLLLSKDQGFGSDPQMQTRVTEINQQAKARIDQLGQELTDNELVQQAVDASSSAIGRVQEILKSVKIDLEDLSDPDVKSLQQLHDNIYYSGTTDYSDLLVLAGGILTRRMQANIPDIEKAKEDAKSETLENVKRLQSTKVDVPGGMTAQGLAMDQSARRRAALEAARSNS